MFRIEYLPVPAEFQTPAPAAPVQHDLGADPAAALVAAAAAQDAQKNGGAEAAGGGALVFLIGVVAFVLYAAMGADKPGEGSSIGREGDSVPMPKRPTSVGSLAGEALDLDAGEYDDLFMGNRRHFDAEGKRLFDMVRQSAGEEGFYAVLDGSRLRHGQERQRAVNEMLLAGDEEYAALVEAGGLNGSKRSRRSR